MSDLQSVTTAAKRYRRSSSKVDRDRQELRDELRAANAAGASLRQLAAASDLSFARVHQIIKGR